MKVRPIMAALAEGWPGAQVCVGPAPNKREPFVVWGQIWLAEDMIRAALRTGRRFYQIDNGFYKPARGSLVGYYRFMYSRPDPVVITDEALLAERMTDPALHAEFAPWRRGGRHVLVAMPGLDFGRAFGVDVPGWSALVRRRVAAATDRPVVVRERSATNPLAVDLAGCWAVVTHSSNVAVEAVLAGVPVFVEPTSMAAPVGNLRLADIERPAMPDRAVWWASLMCQQYSVTEMRSGVALRYLREVKSITETERARSGRSDARAVHPGLPVAGA